jgi:hypothetical protein
MYARLTRPRARPASPSSSTNNSSTPLLTRTHTVDFDWSLYKEFFVIAVGEQDYHETGGGVMSIFQPNALLTADHQTAVGKLRQAFV